MFCANQKTVLKQFDQESSSILNRNMEYIQSDQKDGEILADIRAAAMKPSLVALGRYDESRVRHRFLDTFIPTETYKIILDNELVGFYVIRNKVDHLYLDHLYIKPVYQNAGLGKTVIDKIAIEAASCSLPIRLGALRGSRSNNFYIKNGFVKTHEDEFDIYYEYKPYQLTSQRE